MLLAPATNRSNVAGTIKADVCVPSLYDGNNHSVVGYFALYVSGITGATRIYDGANGPVFVAELFPSVTPKKCASRWGVGGMGVVVNGGAVVTSAYDGALLVENPIGIGYSNASGADFLWGHIKHLLIFNRALSDAEMIALTS